MKTIRRVLYTITFGGFAAAAFAQAPIVRQPPTPPDGQQPQPQYQQQYPAQQGQDPQQGQSPQQGQYPPQGQYAQPQDQQGPPPPPIPPQQLDQLVSRIALYPDPLLAQTLTASTYGNEIADAAGWADQHGNLTGDQLGQAIQADNLSFDPSVLALLPFPSVLDMMAQDPGWVTQLGNAVLAQRQDVMDAVQRQRQHARGYGYLESNQYDNVVDDGGYVEIQPLNPTLLYVPIYDPRLVFYAPRPGFFVGGAIRFGPAITIGTTFGRYGWFGAGFGWSNHAILIDRRPWGRTWVNRGAYVHPYARPYARPEGQRIEHHEVQRSEGRRR
ncbi:DUF3300 domain-containing protein [Granulicella arctica]|uniref:DUF3300 domain-containing protein n=1 Tax=Granulicella arctica TaxID=940613 RepID=UPI0021DFC947|nr:DUF3300 domain-containing protein [Granulicella arctica]